MDQVKARTTWERYALDPHTRIIPYRPMPYRVSARLTRSACSGLGNTNGRVETMIVLCQIHSPRFSTDRTPVTRATAAKTLRYHRARCGVTRERIQTAAGVATAYTMKVPGLPDWVLLESLRRLPAGDPVHHLTDAELLHELSQ